MSDQEQAAQDPIREQEFQNGMLLWAPWNGMHFGVFVGNAEKPREEERALVAEHPGAMGSSLNFVVRADSEEEWDEAPRSEQNRFMGLMQKYYVGIAQKVAHDEKPLTGPDDGVRRLMRTVFRHFLQGEN